MAFDYFTEILPVARHDEWSSFVATSREGSTYALPKYLTALSRADGGRFSVLGVRYRDELVGGVALYQKALRFGLYVAPRPLLYYNGVLLRRYDTRYPSEKTSRHLKTLGALRSALAEQGYSRLTLASPSSMNDARTFLAAGWDVSPRYTYVVRFGDLDLLWNKVDQNLRRLVKRCERERISVHQDGDFESFFHLHASIMGRRNQEPYLPKSVFRVFFQELLEASLCRLFEARTSGGRVIASQLVLLGPNPVCQVAAAATDMEFQHTGVSAFLRWKSFEALSKIGYVAADLTDATLNPVTHFKSQLGGDLEVTLMLDAPRSVTYWFVSGAKDLLARTSRTARFLLRHRQQT